ncbi:hypothetical protein PMG71_07155 [Roseofilum sp. BLCC_M154]|uniref:Uncharacterized protein n=1 Tax=Roseofilum acuticapitatum BLCC-M154 TaxID=3022444 RepID=A0ABT7AQL9_9CYAN|nr:hypothetical protein [Roseofilum acuticapitatum]MDJ1169198.1 hypothetical protein [Roseofilum acuticapitatum BLCC-M154]
MVNCSFFIEPAIARWRRAGLGQLWVGVLMGWFNPPHADRLVVEGGFRTVMGGSPNGLV